MEFALDARIPNYAGGLGVLAADIMHSCADKSAPVVGVSLVYHQDDKNPFAIEQYMKKLDAEVTVQVEDREVTVCAYEYEVKSAEGEGAKIIFLSTYSEKNQEWDRDITRYLYSSHQYTRIAAEAILGIGGVRMLRALGYNDIDVFHMNEGHSAFLTFEILKENGYQDAEVRKHCTFTTHTPVAAGHDYFEYPIAGKILGDQIPWHIREVATKDRLSMTHLAMNLSRKSNSVAKKHQGVCAEMFPGYRFENITNGIHHLSWVSPHMAKLFDKRLKGWRKNPEIFAEAKEKLSDKEVMESHKKAKKELIDFVNKNRGAFPILPDLIEDDYFDEDTLTITFARRFVPYKRPNLIFTELEKLRDLGHKKIQLIFAGRCHPDDLFCTNLQNEIRDAGRRLRSQIRVAVISYDIDIAKKLVAGSDIWLNNPIKPREASGTSGMKAALNGVLNLSLLDGWWIEGYEMEPESGWAFGDRSLNAKDEYERNSIDAEEMYKNLNEVIAEYYQKDHKKWAARMKSAVSLLRYFSTHRVVDEYYDVMWKTGE
jgi:starch phosphorylase